MAGALRCRGAGNNGDFLHPLPSSHFPFPPLLLPQFCLFILKFQSLSAPLPPSVAFYVCACVWMCAWVRQRARWLDALCHGVRWHQPVVDGKIKCNTIDIRPNNCSHFQQPSALRVSTYVGVACEPHLTHKRDVIHEVKLLRCCIVLYCVCVTKTGVVNLTLPLLFSANAITAGCSMWMYFSVMLPYKQRNLIKITTWFCFLGEKHWPVRSQSHHGRDGCSFLNGQSCLEPLLCDFCISLMNLLMINRGNQR